MRRSPSSPIRAASLAAVLAIALALAACSDESAVPAVDAAASLDGHATDEVAADAEPDTETDVHVADAASDSDAPLACPGGAGCPCASNVACDIGLCLPTPAGRQCARPCFDTCPHAYICAPAPLPGGGDAITICVPAHGLICDPCTTDQDCAVPGLAGTGCLAYDHGERFCAGPCAAEGAPACPDGSHCATTTTVGGQAGSFCVRDAPVADAPTCPCTPHAVEAKLTTTCEVDKLGANGELLERCAGVRLCAPDGAPVCSEVSGPGAVCVDAQCVGKAEKAACDDGDPCTNGESCLGGACADGVSACECEANADCAYLEDDDPCNGTLMCDGSTHTCVVNKVTVVTCPEDDDPCTTVACDPKTGSCHKALVASGTPCKANDPCLQYACDDSGACVAEPTCECLGNDDCPDDGDPCNGTPYCKKPDDAPWTCEANPTTVIECPAGKDGACVKNLCQPLTGACAMTALGANTACDDANACTTGDHCQDGACLAGTTTCPCGSDADCASKEDGDVCNGTLFCNLTSGQCEANPATVVSCPTAGDSVCAFAACVAATGECGVVHAAKLTACDDGSPCTTGEVCDGDGTCGGVGLANTCTCTEDADCAGKDDGNLCNGTMFCNQQTGGCQVNPATSVNCPSVDDTPCRMNVCAPKVGVCAMVDLAPGTACDDGEPCTANDGCDGDGGCVAGAVVICPCQSDVDCAEVDDGDPCDGGWYCDKAGKQPQCKWNPASVVTCKQGDPCATWACAPASGTCVATPTNEAGGCDDGDLCTIGDPCGGGVCLAGAATTCDDGNVCTDELCEPAKGCVTLAAQATCSDGDACTQGETCGAASCGGGEVVDCDDGSDCTADSCQPQSGCAHAAVGGECDDSNECTQGELCGEGVCGGGQQIECDDANTCTDDGCKSDSGCVQYTVPKNGQVCGDIDVCVDPATCNGGVCTAGAGPKCDDGNACTADTCSLEGLCTNAPLGDGASCGELSIQQCAAGACVVECPDGYEAVEIDVAGAKATTCAAVGPVWGGRPDTPIAVYEVKPSGGAEVVVDTQTGLMWQRKGSPKVMAQAAAVAWCDALVDAGHSDWRLPSLHELASLLDHTVASPGPASDLVAFPDTHAYSYWTTSTPKSLAGKALEVNFNSGTTKAGATTAELWVRCVRLADAYVLPAPRYYVAPGGATATDTWTGLTWERGTTSGKKSRPDAIGYCEALTLAEATDWRLPTVRELHGLVAVNPGSPAIDHDAFPQAPSTRFWSASLVDNGQDAHVIDFSLGGHIELWPATQGPHDVRCVRGTACGEASTCDDGDPLTVDACAPANGVCSHTWSLAAGCAAAGGTMQGDVYCLQTDQKGVAWALVPPGRFWMGCNAELDETCAAVANENPQHEVAITKPFWLALTEATVAQYKACVDNSACPPPGASATFAYNCQADKPGANWTEAGPVAGRDEHPLNCVRWPHAKTYCEWLGGRLPTEAEWELAARGRCADHGLTGCAAKMPLFPWGDEAPQCEEHAVFVAGSMGCGQGTTRPVKTGSAAGRGPYGHYDLAGNVAEVTSDWYAPAYYSSYAAQGWPPDPENKQTSEHHPARGGSLGDQPLSLRSSTRVYVDEGAAYDIVGLRCARSYP